jgi:tetratricopeptide (TPR) repeat protein
VNIDSLTQRGIAAFQQGDYNQTLAHLKRVLRERPTHVQALLYRGFALQQLRQFDDALGCFTRIIALDPRNRQALDSRAFVLGELGRFNEAVESLQQSIALDPTDIRTLMNLGLAFGNLRRLAEAHQWFSRVLELQPSHAAAWFNSGLALGSLYLESGDRDSLAAALDCFNQALALTGDHPDLLSRKAGTLAYLGRHEEALACLQRALAMQPDNVDALANYGIELRALQRQDEALVSLDRALALAPGFPDARFERSLLLLSMGRLREGFAEFESRWLRSPLKDHRLQPGTPLWLGKTPVSGRTVLLHHDQGLGDTLQFVRYASAVAALGAQVIVWVPQPLRSLLATVPGVGKVVTDEEPMPEHDVHCPIMSLPHVFGTTLETVPAAMPYLAAEPARIAFWRERLGGQRNRPRVGLTWSGRQYGLVNFPRDIPLELLLPLFEIDCEFVSLQQEIPARDTDALRRCEGRLRHGEVLDDFADTAALVENLDLVLTVDTSVAHLAGALNRPLWIMNRFNSCWRWMRARTDSPWYPSARLFWQSSLGDWAGVVADVRTALDDWQREWHRRNRA